MKIYRNLENMQRKERLGRRLSTAGLVVLLIGLFASFTPNLYPLTEPAPGFLGQFMQRWWTYISMAALPLGFILASIGSYFINRFARRRWPGSKKVERPDEVLSRNLKGFDDKVAYYAYSLPPNYTVVGPAGIQIFAVRSDKGRVVIDGEKWREPFNFGRIFTVFAREGVGNPSAEIGDQAGKLRALLNEADAKQAELFADVPIEGAAVFLNSDVQLEITNPSVPALRADQVKDYLRRRAKELNVRNSTVRELNDYLASRAMYQDDEE
ncbi:MAG: hypothetical protein H6642_13600 [Caldilineaceae bacterium]|nr:hypothetical protein [Caldilineaceae bacterium]